jgi:hypothetical protein
MEAALTFPGWRLIGYGEALGVAAARGT